MLHMKPLTEKVPKSPISHSEKNVFLDSFCIVKPYPMGQSNEISPSRSRDHAESPENFDDSVTVHVFESQKFSTGMTWAVLP